MDMTIIYGSTKLSLVTRGNRTPGSRDATGYNSLVTQARCCSSFQLTHMTMFGRLSWQWRPKELSTELTASQHGEFRHVSVSERQRSRLCGQNLCGAFVRLYWQPTSKRAIEQWQPTAQQKRLYLHHQGEFQHQSCVTA